MSNFRLYIQKTKINEGGLSKNPHDNASSYPVPDGSGYHTNKGITWKTYESFKLRKGEKPDVKEFYRMPDSLFEDIFESFWIKSGAHYIIDQPIAELVFQSYWGGGYRNNVLEWQYLLRRDYGKSISAGGVIGPETAAAINSLNDNDAANFALEMVEIRLSYMKRLPDWDKFGSGWQKKYLEFKETIKIYFKYDKKKVLIISGLILLLLLAPALFVRRKN